MIHRAGWKQMCEAENQGLWNFVTSRPFIVKLYYTRMSVNIVCQVQC